MCNQLINDNIDLWERVTQKRVVQGEDRVRGSGCWMHACLLTCTVAAQSIIDPVVEPKKPIRNPAVQKRTKCDRLVLVAFSRLSVFASTHSAQYIYFSTKPWRVNIDISEWKNYRLRNIKQMSYDVINNNPYGSTCDGLSSFTSQIDWPMGALNQTMMRESTCTPSS